MPQADNPIDFSQGFADAVQRAEPVVVRVQGHARQPSTGIVWSDDGLVITSLLALADAEDVQVTPANATPRKAEVVGREPALDLALLRLDGDPTDTATARDALRKPAFAAPDELRVGQWVVALGRPGEAIRASARILGVLAPGLRTGLGARLDRYVESDRGFPRGFVGGPLIDVQGRVLGMNTTAVVRGADLSVPVPTLERAVVELLAHGKVRRGYLGVGVQPVTLPEALRAQTQRERALLVFSVAPRSPAAQAGVLLGDAILDVGARSVADPRELSAALQDAIGAGLDLRIVRAGQLQTLRITPGERT